MINDLMISMTIDDYHDYLHDGNHEQFENHYLVMMKIIIAMMMKIIIAMMMIHACDDYQLK